MIRYVVPWLFLLISNTLHAQIIPEPSRDTPRVQTVQFIPNVPVQLTMLPETPLTVMLRQDETIIDVTPGGEDFRVRVSSERNSFVILPAQNALSGTLDVITSMRSHRFELRVSNDFNAALLVRFSDERAETTSDDEMILSEPVRSNQIWSYRFRGDREVRPESLSDDGVKTRISYASGRALPAVFAIGPSGEEEVVNGYMRDDVFIIDRVYSELVFRIDREKATARRNQEPEPTS
ncbi:hypothetical protein BA950_07675 [Erythrobacter sp. SAORIC-644]|uniref:TrbG/VirB9 family P-type conjugative transfer protein n=1 Tax=Erythrobacter sp. SAORIC-644 TaxID=1869314 RepID=UPI000C9FBF87|nr:TrbG/VirB9 family P-type conjugative transfer protein [Erythrobacter sp. SAORIC-644]PNQ76347.1 hypothetical protein BA950_07675 [Erythrobacter sp. SAORIC-644]